MGQYYRGVILNNEKTEVIKALIPYAFDNGAKLMEHSYIGNSYVKAYEHLLATTFYNKPFVWVGDYADKDWYNKADEYCDNRAKENYQLQTGEEMPSSRMFDYEFYEKINRHIIYYKYILNFDTKEYVKIPKRSSTKWKIHPLPLLCADGNGRGGGDYMSDADFNKVGIWAYNKIGVQNETPPPHFTELKVNFKE